MAAKAQDEDVVKAVVTEKDVEKVKKAYTDANNVGKPSYIVLDLISTFLDCKLTLN